MCSPLVLSQNVALGGQLARAGKGTWKKLAFGSLIDSKPDKAGAFKAYLQVSTKDIPVAWCQEVDASWLGSRLSTYWPTKMAK